MFGIVLCVLFPNCKTDYAAVMPVSIPTRAKKVR